MNNRQKLIIIKTFHSLIWLFYNVVIFYFVYAVIAGKIDFWLWLCLGLVILECIILLVFKKMCPVTIIARRYSHSPRDNFDIFLPNWLARYNKLIYSIIMGVGVLILLYRLAQ